MKYTENFGIIFTSQNMAPYLGGGESHTRYRFFVPPAHAVEHGVHSLQGPQPPRSESIEHWMMNFCFTQMHNFYRS